MVTRCVSLQVDPGIVNYGYGNFEEEEAQEATQDTPKPRPSLRPFMKTQQEGDAAPLPNPRIQRVVVSPRSTKEKEEEEEENGKKKEETAKEDKKEDDGSGPKVEVIPASPSSLSPPSVVENSQSQENLELLLSPKTLE